MSTGISVRFRTHNFKTGLLADPQNGQYPAGTHATLSRGRGALDGRAGLDEAGRGRATRMQHGGQIASWCVSPESIVPAALSMAARGSLRRVRSQPYAAFAGSNRGSAYAESDPSLWVKKKAPPKRGSFPFGR